MQVGIIGATGLAGQALAARLASVGIDVGLGSRSAERAREVCEALVGLWPDLHLPLVGVTNQVAAGADLVVVATPWEAAAPTVASLAGHLDGKVVVSMANALTKVGRELRPVDVGGGSVAAGVQAAVPDALVVAAFHHLPAKSLAALGEPLEGDVLVCSDHEQAVKAASELVQSLPSLRPLHAGSLAMAGPVEAFTAVILGLNIRYRSHAAIRVTGLVAGDGAASDVAGDGAASDGAAGDGAAVAPRRSPQP